MELRPYQQQAVDAVEDKLSRDRCALVATCVGSGKSLIIAECAKKYKRAVIVQPSQELVLQNYRKLVDSGLDCTMIDGVHKGDWSADYIFTTPQTLGKNLLKLVEPDVLIADEVHWGYIGLLWKTIRAKWRKCKLIGLTATPRYYKSKIVYDGGWMWSETTCCSIAADIFGPPVLEIDRETLLSMGYGKQIDMVKRPEISQLEEDHLKNYAVYKPIVDAHLKAVFDLLRSIPNALIYCDSKRHAELLNDKSNGAIRLLFGTTNKKERAQLIADFLEGKIKYIATVGCGKMGLDLPNLSSILILTNVGNPDLLEQMVGRLNRGDGPKTCYYNSYINKNKPVIGKTTRIKIKQLK